MWFEQSFAGDKASLKAGQLAADAEFFFSELSTMFLQSDWPTIAAVNLPSGGAAYPLSTPGVRLKVDPIKNVSLLLAVLNGDPAGPGPGDEQLRNRYGLNFRVNDPAFVIGEAQFQRNLGKKDEGLATTLEARRLGALRASSTTSALPSAARCSPIRRAPACRSSIAATTASTR